MMHERSRAFLGPRGECRDVMRRAATVVYNRSGRQRPHSLSSMSIMNSQSSDHEHLGHAVLSSANPSIAPPIYCCSRHGTGMRSTGGRRWCRSRVTIDVLPDVALLRMFDLYLDEENEWVEAWHTLVHVCRKWRIIVFGSARRLNLRLLFTARTSVRKTLDVWPLLPIVVWRDGHEKWGVDNIIAALLEHNNRICDLHRFSFPNPQMEIVLAAMGRPFPALTRLSIRSMHEAVAVPASFLGGSAPCLRSLDLTCISFPGLPKLLLSATHLVDLRILDIPDSAYFSPESMVTCLSVLTRLESLEFEPPQSSHTQRSRRSPPLTRVILPILNRFRFVGVSIYLDELVARIDAPQLENMDISFFHQPVFDTPQLTQFISRTPKFKPPNEAHVVFVFDSDSEAWVSLPQQFGRNIRLGVSSDSSNLSLAQICSLSFPQAFISAVEHLYIFKTWPDECLENGIQIDSSHWVDILHPFTAVKGLYISEDFVPHITPVLQELAEQRATEVLPTLDTLFLEGTLSPGPVQEAIGHFVASRQLSGHPIAVFRWRLDCVMNIYEYEINTLSPTPSF